MGRDLRARNGSRFQLRMTIIDDQTSLEGWIVGSRAEWLYLRRNETEDGELFGQH